MSTSKKEQKATRNGNSAQKTKTKTKTEEANESSTCRKKQTGLQVRFEDPQNATLVRCPDVLEQNEFQAEEVTKPVRKENKCNLDGDVCFLVASQDILRISQETVKSLENWYNSPQKDTRRGSEVLEQASVLQAIDKCGLPGKMQSLVSPVHAYLKAPVATSSMRDQHLNCEIHRS
ncbi:reverse transcriptase [Plakobranchus ocellatus]|uniref:Reverse transcriptase n=1 Tax=Plakobranchus ocellatus TaxID=259542 RepID=A0AAV4C7Y4_9GAST|nr:reverse transcriptase [Plakobranchus ocellatus]